MPYNEKIQVWQWSNFVTIPNQTKPKKVLGGQISLLQNGAGTEATQYIPANNWKFKRIVWIEWSAKINKNSIFRWEMNVCECITDLCVDDYTSISKKPWKINVIVAKWRRSRSNLIYTCKYLKIETGFRSWIEWTITKL